MCNTETMLNDDELRAPLCQDRYSLLPNDFFSDSNKIILLLKYKITIASRALQLSTETRFSALVLFHRFLCRTVADNGRSDVLLVQEQFSYFNRASMACIFLACKLCDEPRRIRDIINLGHVINFSHQSNTTEKQNSSSLTNDGAPLAPFQFNESQAPPELDVRYWEQKDDLVSLEQDILRLLNFDTKVCHPHRAVIALMTKFYYQTEDAEAISRRSELVMNSWKLLNDSSLFAPALRHPSLALASAVLYMSAKKLVFEEGNHHQKNDAEEGCDDRIEKILCIVRADGNKWWSTVGISDEYLSCAIHDVMHATSLSTSFG